MEKRSTTDINRKYHISFWALNLLFGLSIMRELFTERPKKRGIEWYLRSKHTYEIPMRDIIFNGAFSRPSAKFSKKNRRQNFSCPVHIKLEKFENKGFTLNTPIVFVHTQYAGHQSAKRAFQNSFGLKSVSEKLHSVNGRPHRGN